MKVALAQTAPTTSFEQNLASALEGIAEAACQGAELVILPETWMRTFGGPLDPVQTRQQAHRALDRWRAACAAHGIASYGSLPWYENDRWTNRGWFIDAGGAPRAHYDKIHLFTLLGEDERFSAGTSIVVLPVGPFCAGLSVCYDLRFPELYRAQIEHGADLLLICAQWPAARAAHWRALATARAIENQSWVIAVNRAGRASGAGDLDWAGGSLVVDPWGDVVLELDDQPRIATTTINPGRVTHIRASHPFLEDRRAIEIS